MELAQRLDTFGLPLSFGTSKAVSDFADNMHLKSETQTLQRSFVLAESPLRPLGDYHDNFICCIGGWWVIWDPFYANNYFFNVQTLELTWYPPLGLEKYAFAWRNTFRKETREGAAEKNATSKHSCGSISVVTDSLPENGGGFHFTDKQGDMIGSYYEYDRKMPTENGNTFSFPEAYVRSPVEKVQKLTGCHSISLVKYWHQRYSLFSRFDNGIKMDEESWFSVTPERIAKHHAFRCGAGTIIDCFSGVGGNAIQFAMRSNNVIAIDVDPKKIDYAQHNAIIYGVGGRINFIKGDFFKIAPTLKGDVVFLAPPWGGPNYIKMKTYDLRSLEPRDGYYLFKIASKIAPKVVMFLPRNVNLDQLKELSLLADPPWKLEVEKNYLRGKLKSITAYFDKATLN